MAGHSKWANIKHRKAAQDARRGRIFTRLIRELTTAARMGGGDPGDNSRLRLAMDKAAAVNVPRTTVERAVLRGSGALGGTNLEECVYEGYGPGGVAVLVEACTDNRNRIVAEIRHAFSSHAGQLGTEGSVAWLFKKCGQLVLVGADEEAVMQVAEEGDANDIEPLEDGFLLLCEPQRLSALMQSAEKAGLNILESSFSMVPNRWLTPDAEVRKQLEGLLAALEALEEVQEVHCNVQMEAAAVEMVP